MAVPSKVRETIKEKIWEEADRIDWMSMNITQKSIQYNQWAEDEALGIVLSHYIPYQSVHKYLKDSILKPYSRSKQPKNIDISRLLNLDDSLVEQDYVKPLGFRLDDGLIVCWGRAVDWKIVLLSIFERSKERGDYAPHAAILTDSSGKFLSDNWRSMVKDASDLLGIERILFLD
jgi:hypothetical protein